MKEISRLIKNGNTTLNTKICSPEKEETIILLHGGPGVPDEMPEVVEYFCDKYRVIQFEQRGVGLSKCGDNSYKMESYISDIDTIAGELNLGMFHLFGHSWGGLYAQIYALKRMGKIKSLFLCSPGSGTNELWKKTEKEVLQFNKNSSNSIEWLRMGWNSLLGMLGSDSAYRKMFEQVLKNYHLGYGDVQVNRTSLKGVHAAPVNKTRKEIIKYKPLTVFLNPNIPVMITYGENDIYGESKNELIRRYPATEAKIIENCGHIPWKHNWKDFKTVLDWFYKILEKKSIKALEK